MSRRLGDACTSGELALALGSLACTKAGAAPATCWPERVPVGRPSRMLPRPLFPPQPRWPVSATAMCQLPLGRNDLGCSALQPAGGSPTLPCCRPAVPRWCSPSPPSRSCWWRGRTGSLWSQSVSTSCCWAASSEGGRARCAALRGAMHEGGREAGGGAPGRWNWPARRHLRPAWRRRACCLRTAAQRGAPFLLICMRPHPCLPDGAARRPGTRCTLASHPQPESCQSVFLPCLHPSTCIPSLPACSAPSLLQCARPAYRPAASPLPAGAPRRHRDL